MPYSFAAADPGVTAAVRRIAREEIGAALADLDAVATPDLIHGLRKRTKKLRGLIRLVRPRFEDHAAENAAFRDAARAISGLRDAQVTVLTLERLMAGDGRAGDETLTRLRHDAMARAGAAAGEDGLAAFRAAMAAAMLRVGGWEIRSKGFAALEPGLMRTWAQAQHAQKAARRGGGAAAMHDWRKRVKDHWYHARLLAPIWPEMMAPHVAAADALGEMLGERNDLAVLCERLPVLLSQKAARAAIERRACKLQAKLDRRAFALADRLFAESPGALAARWGRWWAVRQQDGNG